MKKISIDGKTYLGFDYKLGNLPMILIKAKKGYVACSYLAPETAEKVGDVAAFVTGVKNIEGLYNAKIRKITSWAEEIGIREGMSVRKALEIMDAD